MEQEKLPVTLSEFIVLGDTNEDTGKVTLECFILCGCGGSLSDIQPGWISQKSVTWFWILSS